MNNTYKQVIRVSQNARKSLELLDALPYDNNRTLFVIAEHSNKLLGTITDGDIRRGLLGGLEISGNISLFMNKNFKYLKNGNDNIKLINELKCKNIFILPLVDKDKNLIDVVNLRVTKTILPLTVLLMAGGRGERLKPMTNNIPKPMLKIDEKPILEHNINRLISFGIKEIYISVKYLKEQIIDYFGDGFSKGIKIFYIEENDALGTIGALSFIDSILHKDILVMNSDLLTNIDFEEFYSFYKEKNATMALASIPYQVDVPYAVIETNDFYVSSFCEKPTYTYYSNGGIYLLNFELKKKIARGNFFNATDLMDIVISDSELNLVHYPLLGYWLDIGKPQDYSKAQEDIKHIKF